MRSIRGLVRLPFHARQEARRAVEHVLTVVHEDDRKAASPGRVIAGRQPDEHVARVDEAGREGRMTPDVPVMVEVRVGAFSKASRHAATSIRMVSSPALARPGRFAISPPVAVFSTVPQSPRVTLNAKAVPGGEFDGADIPSLGARRQPQAGSVPRRNSATSPEIQSTASGGASAGARTSKRTPATAGTTPNMPSSMGHHP
jgi:hypothetical protein